MFTVRAPRGLTNRDVYNALIDSAVDEKLAVAIFRAVSQGKKASNSGIAAVPLETLSIRVMGGGCIGARPLMERTTCYELRPYLCSMERCWQVDRDPRDDRRGVLHAVEVGRDSRLRVDDIVRRAKRNCWILPIFRQIWPEKAEGSNWYDDWESLPLEGVGND